MKLYDLMLDPKFDIQDYIEGIKNELELYKKECSRLNNIINEINKQLKYLETYSSKEDVFEDMKRRLDNIEKIINRK